LVPGVQIIEDLLDNEAKNIIGSVLKLDGCPTKGQIRRFFQERLASDDTDELGAEFSEKARVLLDALKSRLNA
jgi:hypothetical protein